MSGFGVGFGFGDRLRSSSASSSSGAGGGVARMVSAANRSRVAQTRSAQVNPVRYFRNYERPVRDLKGVRGIYANIATIVGIANGERGTQCTVTIRGSFVTGLSGLGIDQSGGSTSVCTFSDARNDRWIAVGGGRMVSPIVYVDRTTNPNTCTPRTYAEFVAAGGSIGASTVNGASVADTVCDVPECFAVLTDAGPDVTAATPYFAQLEVRTPVITVTGITVPVAGDIVVATANTSNVKVGDTAVIASATGNTSVNGTWVVSGVVANTSISFTGTTSTTGTVTGSPTCRFFALSGQIVASRTSNPLGDYSRGSATVQDYIGGGNWTGLGANGASDGIAQDGWTAIVGSDPYGGKGGITFGDSIIAEVRDGTINDPASTLLGSAYGDLAFLNRALNAAGYPAIRCATPGMGDGFYTYGDDSFRRWLANFADVAVIENGHNYVSSAGSYTAFKARQTLMFTNWRAALRPGGRVVATTLTPTTTSASDHWTTSRTSAHQTFASNFSISSYIYTSYHPDLVNPAVLLTGAAGGVDAVLDVAQIVSDLAGAATIDGYWPVDGTPYKYTTDGTHPSKDGHIGIAAGLTAGVLAAALGF